MAFFNKNYVTKSPIENGKIFHISRPISCILNGNFKKNRLQENFMGPKVKLVVGGQAGR